MDKSFERWYELNQNKFSEFNLLQETKSLMQKVWAAGYDRGFKDADFDYEIAEKEL